MPALIMEFLGKSLEEKFPGISGSMEKYTQVKVVQK
jgi:hypothetical protein